MIHLLWQVLLCDYQGTKIRDRIQEQLIGQQIRGFIYDKEGDDVEGYDYSEESSEDEESYSEGDEENRDK